MLKRIGANIAAQAIPQVLTFLDRFVFVGTLVRAWGPEVYADWALLFAGVGLISLGDLGLGIYFGNNWQHANAHGDTQRFNRLIGVALYCYLVLAAVVISLLLYCGLVLQPAELFSVRHMPAADARTVFVLLGLTMASMLMRGSISQVYRGRGEFARGTLVTTLPLAGYLLLGIPAAQFGAMPAVVACIYLGCDMLGTIFMVSDLKRREASLSLKPYRPSSEEVRDILSQGRWNLLLQGVPIAWLQVPVLMLGAIGIPGAALTGFLLLRTLINFLRSFTTIISLSAAVEIAPMLHRGQHDRLAPMLMTTGRSICGFVGAVCAGIAFFGEDFMALWSGRRDLFDSVTMYWMIAAAITGTAAMPLFALFMLGNRPKPAALASLLQLVLGLAACATLAVRYGPAGAAAGLALGEIAAAGFVLPLLARDHFMIDAIQYLKVCASALLLCSVWCGAVCWVIVAIVGSDTTARFLISAGLYGVLGFMPVMIAVLSPEHRSALMDKVMPFIRRLPFRLPR